MAPVDAKSAPINFKKKMIKLFEPFVSEYAKENVQRVLSGTQLAQGPEVDAFEKEFALVFGFEAWQIVSLNSGTSALELAYELCNIGKESEVITPVLTCTATNIPLVRRGAQIVFGDIDGKRSLNIDPNDIVSKIGEKTKAIVFVHFGGSSEGLEEVETIAEHNDIDLICDAAQALGSKLSQEARFSCISLQAIKSLTTGDGGILICRDEKDAVKARKLRWFGYDRALKQKLGDTDLDLAGYKMHMNDIAAALGRGNLLEWSRIKKHRLAINAVYALFGANKGYLEGMWCPQVVGLPFAQMYTNAQLAGFEVGQYHYPNSKYSIFRYAENDCPNMDRLKDHYFMLPCHMGVSLADAQMIAKTIWR